MIESRNVRPPAALAGLALVSMPAAAHPGEHAFVAAFDAVAHWLTSPYHLLAAAAALAGCWLLAAAVVRRFRSRARVRMER